MRPRFVIDDLQVRITGFKIEESIVLILEARIWRSKDFIILQDGNEVASRFSEIFDEQKGVEVVSTVSVAISSMLFTKITGKLITIRTIELEKLIRGTIG